MVKHRLDTLLNTHTHTHTLQLWRYSLPADSSQETCVDGRGEDQTSCSSHCDAGHCTLGGRVTVVASAVARFTAYTENTSILTPAGW